MKVVKNEYIKALIKITPNLNYAQDFRDGKLWMNRLAFFHGLEKKEIGDKNEGRALSFQTSASMINVVDASSMCMPIFCLYAIYGDNRTNTIIQISTKMLKFGQYAVIVKDVDSFLTRIQQAGLEFSPVYYYPAHPDTSDPDFRIPFCPEYRKLHEFQYQSEFRLVRRQTLLTKDNTEKYDWLSRAEVFDDDHYVAQIEGGLSDITTEILQTKSLACPRNRKIQLNTDWNRVRVQDHIKYKNPFLGQGEEL